MKDIHKVSRQQMSVHTNVPALMYDVCNLCVCVQSSQCMWLMQALGFLLSALPEDEVLVRLHSLISPHVQQLDTLATEEVIQDKKKKKQDSEVINAV